MTTIPTDRLDRLVARWQTVQGALAAGADQESYVRLSREFAELDPIVATITALRRAEKERDDLNQMIDDPAADLHEWYGRFLYFAPDELQPLDLEPADTHSTRRDRADNYSRENRS